MKQNLLIILLIVIAFSANGQKQPQVQELSVRAPSNIKIDGKINEWPNPFQNLQSNSAYLTAYNASSRIFYTVSNNDDYLYLTVRGLGSAAAEKILNGGMSFTISIKKDKKPRAKAGDNMVITFPLPQDHNVVSNILNPIFALNRYVNDTTANRKQIDSLVSLASKRANDALKDMGIIGVKEISDTVISIYNSEGIKGAMGFVKRMPTIEIAIPLKYFNFSANEPKQFSYNIRLSGMALSANDFDLVQKDPGFKASELYGITPSELWGMYTLALKP